MFDAKTVNSIHSIHDNFIEWILEMDTHCYHSTQVPTTLQYIEAQKHMLDHTRILNITTSPTVQGHTCMEALKGHVKFLKKFLYLLIRTYASPN